MSEHPRLARLRRDLARPHCYSEEVEFLMRQLDQAVAARQQAVCTKCHLPTVKRDTDQEHPGVGICSRCGSTFIDDIPIEKALEFSENARQQAEQERDALKNADYVDWGAGELLAHAALDAYPVPDPIPIKSTSVVFRIHQLGHAKEVVEQERNELIKINADLTTEIMGVTHQLKEAEGRLGIVEVEDGRIHGIRITPARDLEYERRVRAEENLKVATDQLDAVTKDRDELDRTARELLDEARRQSMALRAALEQLKGGNGCFCGYDIVDAEHSEECNQARAALAGSRAPNTEQT